MSHAILVDAKTEIKKEREFPRINAKTRWGEPAGHFASSHLAVIDLMEAAGIEPASRDASMKASTCVAKGLFLARSVAYWRGYFTSQRGAFLVRYVPCAVANDPELRLTFGRLRRAPSVRVA